MNNGKINMVIEAELIKRITPYLDKILSKV